MFSSTSTGGSICLRCQLRLTRPRLTPKSSGRPPQRARLSPQVRTNTTEATAAAEPSVPRPTYAGSKYEYAQPLGKLRGAPGSYVREHSATLDAMSLGVPSEVIILRDAKIERSSARELTDPDEEVRLMSAAEMLSSVEVEKELIGAEVINSNIDQHRPADVRERTITKEAFDSLYKELHDGFTMPQLTRYLEHLKTSLKSEAEATSSDLKPTEEPPVLERSAWTLGVTPFVEHKLDNYLYKDSRDLTRKENLAIRVLRDGWGLRIKEEIESLGELELRLRPQKLSLLLNERRAFLPVIVKQWNARIDVSRTRGIVRITADQQTATNVYGIIRDIMTNVHRMEVDLHPLQALLQNVEGGLERLRGSTSHKISELTGTELEFTKDGKKLIISYHGRKAVVESGTNEVQDARRLFLASILPPKNSHPPITWDAKASESLGILCPPTKLDLSWKDREKSWSRWTFPLTAESNEGRNGERPVQSRSSPIVPSSRVRNRVHEDLFGELQENTSVLGLRLNQEECNELQAVSTPGTENSLAVSKTVNWTHSSKGARQVCSVLLGQVLHEAQDATSPQRIDARELMELQNRTMSTSISGALVVLKSLPFRRLHESLYLRLLPSPWTPLGVDAMKAFPEIELRVSLRGDKKEPFLQRVSALLDQRVSDVMLPEKRADLRFRREVTSELLDAREDKVIAAFLRDSHLDTLGRGRLRTPASLNLHVPRRMIKTKDMKLSNTDTIKESIEEVEVEYLFSGLDYRHSVTMDWEGDRLDYTTIEAGKIGGRRTELRLTHNLSTITLPPNSLSDAPSNPPTDLTEFMAKAYRLVNNLGNIATRVRIFHAEPPVVYNSFPMPGNEAAPPGSFFWMSFPFGSSKNASVSTKSQIYEDKASENVDKEDLKQEGFNEQEFDDKKIQSQKLWTPITTTANEL
ncbi:MAG: hypothetical protein M1812_002664 [Candelaria pacifica]|nr:MAG: hypothetical protein M1812_002664 [Candelaria pacifica]